MCKQWCISYSLLSVYLDKWSHGRSPVLKVVHSLGKSFTSATLQNATSLKTCERENEIWVGIVRFNLVQASASFSVYCFSDNRLPRVLLRVRFAHQTSDFIVLVPSLSWFGFPILVQTKPFLANYNVLIHPRLRRPALSSLVKSLFLVYRISCDVTDHPCCLFLCVYLYVPAA